MKPLPTDLDQALTVADWMLQDWLTRHPSFLTKGSVKDWSQDQWASAATDELTRRDARESNPASLESDDPSSTTLLERFPDALLFAIMGARVDMAVVFETSSKTLIDLREELQRRAPGQG